MAEVPEELIAELLTKELSEPEGLQEQEEVETLVQLLRLDKNGSSIASRFLERCLDTAVDSNADLGDSICSRFKVTQGGLYLLGALTGSVKLLKHLLDHDPISELPEHIFTTGLQCGRLDALKLLQKVGADVTDQALALTIFHGHLDVLQWLHAQQLPEASSWPLRGTIVSTAAATGRKDILTWLFHADAGVLPDRFPDVAVKAGQFSILRHLREITGRLVVNKKVPILLAHRGDLDDLKWTIYQMWPYIAGDIEFAHMLVAAALWGPTSQDAPGEYGLLDRPPSMFVRPPDASTPPAQQFLEIMQCIVGDGAHRADHWEEGHLCTTAVLAGALGPLQHFRSLQPPFKWEPETFAAASAGDLDILKWCMEQEDDEEGLKEVGPECSDRRLLMLVCGYGWEVPEDMEDRLNLVKDRYIAFWGAARHCPRARTTATAGTRGSRAQCQTCLADLPQELLKLIACMADIDFSWRIPAWTD